jgi:hypothetical protein
MYKWDEKFLVNFVSWDAEMEVASSWVDVDAATEAGGAGEEPAARRSGIRRSKPFR